MDRTGRQWKTCFPLQPDVVFRFHVGPQDLEDMFLTVAPIGLFGLLCYVDALQVLCLSLCFTRLL